MCHRHVYVRLSAEETKAVRKMSRVLIPAYAFALLALLALVAVNHSPRSGETLTAATELPAVNR